MPQRDIKVEGRGRWYDLPSKQPFLPWASVSISLWCGEAERAKTLQYVLIVTFSLCKTRRIIYFRLWNIKKNVFVYHFYFTQSVIKVASFHLHREKTHNPERKVWTDQMVLHEHVGKIDVLLCTCTGCFGIKCDIRKLSCEYTTILDHLVCCTSLYTSKVK